MLMMATSERGKKRYLCGHCKMKLCKTVFYAHKKLYYNKLTGSWNSRIHKRSVELVEDEDFVFDAESDHSSGGR